MTAQEALGLGLQGSVMLTVLGFGLGATFPQANYLFRQPALLLRSVLVALSALAIVLVPLWVWILDRVFARHAEL